MDKTDRWTVLRIRLVGLGFLAVFVLVVIRAFQLQVLDVEEWERRAERQRQKVIPLPPQRGTIYDRNGEELALSVEVDSIFAEPPRISDPGRAAKALSAGLEIPYAAVKSKLESDRGFVWLKRQASLRESEQVRSLGLDGISFIKEHRRYYPNSGLGAQVVGFTGLDPEGLEGVELQYDSMILGQSGYLLTERDALGRGLGAGDSMVQGGRSGSSLYLTLDKNLQYIAEKELDAGVRQSKARSGTAIILDPHTGEVLAMASQPTFNPNAVSKYRPSQWRNRTICDTYEPGSTFKIILIAAALNEKVVGPGKKFNCENGSFKVGGRVIHDHRPYGTLTLEEIFKYSSNIGVAKIGKILERERFHRYITDFGFGSRTGIDLPGEVSGMVRDPSRWFEVDLAAISFGQGITVTPLQLATAVGAIANGGYLMTPHVAGRLVDSYGQVEVLEPRMARQVVSEEVARRVRDMMVQATEDGGTGALAAVSGYRIGGKTGTAQKVDPVTGGYSVDKRVSSFVGIAPADNPRLVILVVLDEPEGQVSGGLIAAPVFSRIAAQALSYLNIPPDQPVRPEFIVGLPATVETFPENQISLLSEGSSDGKGGLLMPDFIGMSYRQALQKMEQAGINVKLNGSGRVVDQSPAAGRPIQYGTEVWIRFAAPS